MTHLPKKSPFFRAGRMSKDGPSAHRAAGPSLRQRNDATIIPAGDRSAALRHSRPRWRVSAAELIAALSALPGSRRLAAAAPITASIEVAGIEVATASAQAEAA